MNLMVLAGALIGGYLLGSVSGSLLLGRFRGVDIRTQGSGNAGGTNAFRTQGALFALGVVVIDIGKGALAVWLALRLAPAADGDWAASLAGIGAVLGHLFPLYHGFRGGKGAATAVGVIAVLAPVLLGPLLLVWLAVLLSTGYVGLATVLAVLALPLGLLLLVPAGGPALWALALAILVLIVYAHRGNLQRLARGEEYCFERARLLRRRRPAP